VHPAQSLMSARLRQRVLELLKLPCRAIPVLGAVNASLENKIVRIVCKRSNGGPLPIF